MRLCGVDGTPLEQMTEMPFLIGFNLAQVRIEGERILRTD